ncbi:YSC84-related protein [Ningiella sp. W23]|uniref:lipid-binding SYLF domain-containing protein n=1 Tax=Ningiella sp. W23 TaxID=3023715 RepID=UPI0037581221
MKVISIKSAFVMLSVVILSACASMGSGSVTEKRQVILDMQQDALAKLYEKKPAARAEINASPGYATFSNANVNLLVLAAGTGYGVVNDNSSGKKTYMNMAEGGVGLGLGAKDYRIVMVFHNQSAMQQFIENGWTFGGNADAAAKASNKGKAIAGEAYYGDVSVYTMTESGLALQATVKGTKFWKDEQLN